MANLKLWKVSHGYEGAVVLATTEKRAIKLAKEKTGWYNFETDIIRAELLTKDLTSEFFVRVFGE